jgi:hypothetical protein
MVLEAGSAYWLYEDDTIILWGEDPMTYDLFDITYRVVRELGIVEEGIATGGSTTTVVDSDDRTEADDYWNGGTVWMIRDSAGAGAAPEGEYSVISDFANSTGTITLRDTLTAAVASGDRYAAGRKWVPLHIIIQKVNQALIALGPIPYTDTTSITIASNQTEYSLPIAANRKLLKVYLQLDKTDADDNLWVEIVNWEVEKADPGNADTLILPAQYDSGYALKLVYLRTHPELYTSSSVLSEHVPVERVVYPAILACLRYRKQRVRSARFDDDIAYYENLVAQIEANYPVMMPKKPSRLMIVGDGQLQYDDEPGTVYV